MYRISFFPPEVRSPNPAPEALVEHDARSTAAILSARRPGVTPCWLWII
jgi:hypothetical protein